MKLSPMKCKQGDEQDLKNEGWIYEPKLDGIRALCFVNTKMKFVSRNDNDLTKQYAELTFRDAVHAKSCVLDGEIVAYDEDGKLLSFSQWKSREAHYSYVVFDILQLNGKSLLKQPLLQRKKLLDSVVRSQGAVEKVIFTRDGPTLWKLMKKKHMEGVIAKDAHSFYYSNVRTAKWLKIKFTKTVDCVVVGFSSGTRYISSLALALYNDEGQLQYIGKVGTGFNQQNSRTLNKLLTRLKSELSPVSKSLPKRAEGIHWVRPKLVAEIAYSEFTPQLMLRHASFVQLRPDKKPQECTLKEQGPSGGF